MECLFALLDEKNENDHAFFPSLSLSLFLPHFMINRCFSYTCILVTCILDICLVTAILSSSPSSSSFYTLGSFCFILSLLIINLITTTYTHTLADETASLSLRSRQLHLCWFSHEITLGYGEMSPAGYEVAKSYLPVFKVHRGDCTLVTLSCRLFPLTETHLRIHLSWY